MKGGLRMRRLTDTIGLEIHIELSTKSKMFCGCKNDPFGAKKPNIYTCPVCLGLPGALPVPNRKAVEDTILIGLALNCKINKESKFDRKHYFYPDLPKGYQISQYDQPLCEEGYLETSQGKVRITRVHLEEDTGKLLHKRVHGKDVSLVDFNRSGVPLVEIVTEPDIKNGKHAREFAKELQQVVRILKVSNTDMEKGSMRLEANISQGLDLGYKVEVKNLNSFKFVEKAIDYELKRQKEVLKSGKKPRQETRGWDEKGKRTVIQRYKETAADYRYFPEPDIPPMSITDVQIAQIKKRLPKLPDELAEEFSEKGLRKDYAQLIVLDEKLMKFTEELVKIAKDVDINKLVGELINAKVNIAKLTPQKFLTIHKTKHSDKVTDLHQITKWAKKAIAENPKAVEDYKKGKENAIKVLVGRVMVISKGMADPVITLGAIKNHI